MPEIIFNGRNIKLSQKIQSYINEKLKKHEALLTRAIGINVTVVQNKTDHGTNRNFRVEISVNMPHAFIRVEDKGKSIEELTDKLEVVLKRRLKRYHDQFKRWSKEEPWKISEFKDEFYEENYIEPQSFIDYNPEIIRKTYSDDRPMHPAEAIEQMELLGNKAFLFRNIENGKHAMIYKRFDGAYGLIEPET